MMIMSVSDVGLPNDMMSDTGTLTTKDGRKRWESLFSKTFIEPMQTVNMCNDAAIHNN